MVNGANITYERSEFGDDIWIVRVEGRLDAQPSDKLEESLLKIINNGKRKLIIDLNKVHYLGSSAIRVFLGISNKLKKTNGGLRIINMPPTGKKIINAMEIMDRFEIFDSEIEAVNSFK